MKQVPTKHGLQDHCIAEAEGNLDGQIERMFRPFFRDTHDAQPRLDRTGIFSQTRYEDRRNKWEEPKYQVNFLISPRAMHHPSSKDRSGRHRYAVRHEV